MNKRVIAFITTKLNIPAASAGRVAVGFILSPAKEL
jgi:hypothetical protein